MKVWRKAHALVLNVHRVAAGIRSPYLSLRSQMIRAALSIAANIVEGRSKTSEREFARFLGISLASTRELEYFVEVSHDIGAVHRKDFDSITSQSTEVRMMLHGLISTLKEAPSGTPPVRSERSEAVSSERSQ